METPKVLIFKWRKHLCFCEYKIYCHFNYYCNVLLQTFNCVTAVHVVLLLAAIWIGFLMNHGMNEWNDSYWEYVFAVTSCPSVSPKWPTPGYLGLARVSPANDVKAIQTWQGAHRMHQSIYIGDEDKRRWLHGIALWKKNNQIINFIVLSTDSKIHKKQNCLKITFSLKTALSTINSQSFLWQVVHT